LLSRTFGLKVAIAGTRAIVAADTHIAEATAFAK
jgi:hypothetical protein